MSKFTKIALWGASGLLVAVILAAWAGGLPKDQREQLPTVLVFLAMGVIYAALGVAVVWLYVLPAWLAHRTGHRNLAALTAANILLGWTFVGWCICLVWALMKTQQPAPRSVDFASDFPRERAQ